VQAIGVCSPEVCTCISEIFHVVCIKTLQLHLLAEVHVLLEDDVKYLLSQQKLKFKHHFEYCVSVSASE
jgi:hypothetical protein